MRVVVEASVFASALSALSLNTLAYFALTEKHRIVLSDETDPIFVDWLKKRSREDQEEWRVALDTSLVLESREPAKREIIVSAVSKSNWKSTPCQLTLEDALELLSKPLRLLVENNINDRNFLLTACTQEQRELLLQKEASNQLTFEHAGGISSMLQILQKQGDRHPAELHTIGALFDSDAIVPGRPSAQSEQVRRFCARKNFSHHQLSRRAIENYLPPSCLQGWAYTSPSTRAIREPKFRAFLRLTADQKAHFNMKRGFAGDAKRDDVRDAAELFSSLRSEDVLALDAGFGDSVADNFGLNVVTEQDLRRDGSWSELNPIVSDLLALLR